MIRETIRLTEVERSSQTARIKVAGDLHEINCHVFIGKLESYIQDGVEEFHLLIDDVQSIDHTTRDKLLELANDGSRIWLHNPRTFLVKLLELWGMKDWIAH